MVARTSAAQVRRADVRRAPSRRSETASTAPSGGLDAAGVLGLQRTLGNARVTALLQRSPRRVLARLSPEERAEDLQSSKYSDDDRLQRAFDNNPAVHIGESGEAVRLVQEGLVEDCFDMPRSTKPTGELDGGFGQETFDVLEAFQAKHDLEVDGIVGRETLRQLDELAIGGPECPRGAPGATPTAAPPPATTPTAAPPPATTPTAAPPSASPVEPSSVVFFELPSQRFRGYDSTVVPNELVVPLGGEREAGALVVPFPAQATFRTADSSIAEVRPTSDGVRIRGLSDGLTRVEAVAGGTVIGTLFVDVKARRDVTVDFHSASDVDSPPNRSTRPLSDVDRLVATLNEVWGEQANVHFSKRLVDRITVPTALGEEVTDEEIFDFARLRTGAEWNVFFVWEYQPFFLETIPGVFTPQDVEAVTAVNVESGTVTLLEDRECADSLTIAHEAGHFLGMKFGRRGTPPHPPSTIMSICGGLERRRVPSDFADVANP